MGKLLLSTCVNILPTLSLFSSKAGGIKASFRETKFSSEVMLTLMREQRWLISLLLVTHREALVNVGADLCERIVRATHELPGGCSYHGGHFEASVVLLWKGRVEKVERQSVEKRLIRRVL